MYQHDGILGIARKKSIFIIILLNYLYIKIEIIGMSYVVNDIDIYIYI